MNALIGPNNAGKSNIVKALSLVLGETYPSNRTFEENHYFERDQSKTIKIDVMFDNHFTDPRSHSDVYGFRLECDNGNVNYVALNSMRQSLLYNNGTPIRVNQEMRDEIPLVYLDVDRQSAQQIRSTQWTLYGKILKYIEKQIPEAKKRKFSQEVANSFKSELFGGSSGVDLKSLEDHLKNTIRDQTGFDLTLELSVLDPIEAIKNVRPYVKEGSAAKKYDPEEMGAGTQSALTVSVARAYSNIVRKSVILAIEEPEIHFHPQACRNLYNTFADLSNNGLQIIYTTHSQSFVDISDFDSIHIVRKNNGSTTVESGLKLSASSSLTKGKVVSKFNEHVNQALFADKVVLVEGPDDEIACRAMIEKLGFDIFKNNVSVTSCGGKDNIPAIAEVLNSLGIETVALLDEDPGNSGTINTRIKIETILGKDSVLLQSPQLEGLFGYSTKFNQASALLFFSNFNGTSPGVYSDLLTKLT